MKKAGTDNPGLLVAYRLYNKRVGQKSVIG